MSPKKLLSALLLLLCCLHLSAQQHQRQIYIAPVVQDLLGTSVKLNYRYTQKKHVFYAGLGYLINPKERAKQFGDIVYNKAYAKNFLQHFMLSAGYERSITFKRGNIRLFPFTEIVATYTGLKAEYYTGFLSNNRTQLVIGGNYVFNDKGFLFLVNHTGVGCEIPLLKTVSLLQEIGITPGLMIHVKDNYPGEKVESPGGIANAYYSIGLTVRL